MITAKRKSGFAAIPNAAMRDETISIEARGMLALMMGMGENWTFRSKDLQKRCGVGREKYQRMIRELKTAGYLTIEAIRDESGLMDGHNYYIHDEPPQTDTESLKTRPSESGIDGKPSRLRKPTTINTNNKSHQTDLFKESTSPTPKSVLMGFAGEEAVDSFLAYRKTNKKSPVTLTAAKRLASQLEEIRKRGGSPDDALGMIEERGWTSIQVDWYFRGPQSSFGGQRIHEQQETHAQRVLREQGLR